LASLHDLQDGKVLALPESPRARLLDLELIAELNGQVSVTPFGRERLISDR
jgi:hypothetical protein